MKILTNSLWNFLNIYNIISFEIFYNCIQLGCNSRENLLRNLKYTTIYIMSDSQAALKALQSRQIASKLVWECILYRDLKQTQYTECIQWHVA